MFIKYGGGIDGFKKYIEDGKKHGRDLGGRSVMDQRVILFGNLDVTNSIVQMSKTDAENYAHISLSFVERDLPVETLRAITKNYLQLLMSAYREDEYDFYAEAHYAKLKSYRDKTTHAMIDRLDHIHIFIPTINLLTGQRLEPGGFIKHNVRFLDAIQENLNVKYALISPKDRAREDRVGHAQMISRSRLDNFRSGKISDVKNDLREKIKLGMINSYAALDQHLALLGDNKTTNSGKESEYLGVRPYTQNTFINLREPEFRRAFFDLSFANRQAYLGKYLQPTPTPKKVGVGKRNAEENIALIKEWTEHKSLEIKYMNSGSAFYKKYMSMRLDEQRIVLTQRADKFYKKFLENENERKSQSGRERKYRISGEILSQSNVEKARGVPPSRTIHSVQSLHTRHLDRNNRHAQMLLRNAASKFVDDRRTDRSRDVRCDADTRRRRINSDTCRSSDSSVSQMLKDKKGQMTQATGALTTDIQVVKSALDVNRLLVDLSLSHALLPAQYHITKGKDGLDRVRHGASNQTLNVADFLTRHMHMTWADAEKYLRSSYEAQERDRRKLEHVAEIDHHRSSWSIMELHITPVKPKKNRAYNSKFLLAQEYRNMLLTIEYGQSSELLAKYWRMRRIKNKREIIFEQIGSQITDKGSLITAVTGNSSEIEAMIELAKMKNWSSISFTGSDNFKEMAMVAALRAKINIVVKNNHDQAILYSAIAAIDEINGDKSQTQALHMSPRGPAR